MSGCGECALHGVTEEGVVGGDKRGHFLRDVPVAALSLSRCYVCDFSVKDKHTNIMIA